MHFGIAVLLLSATGFPSVLAPGQVKPNVLFIALDDLNCWIGVLGGHPQARTPNIDRLAGRGVLFSNAHCPAPACNPSRASLLCGVRPSTSGVYHNNQPWRPVLKDVVTLPQHFMAHGYDVRGGGKIFHNSFHDPQSWHEWVKEKGNPAPTTVPANGIKGAAHFDWGPVEQGDEAMGDVRIARWAATYLRQKHDKPFFLAPGFIRPHLPWYVPRKYFDEFPLGQIQLPRVIANDLSDVPVAGQSMAKPNGDHRKVMLTNNWQRAVQGYLASILFADTCVGIVLDALASGPNAENTIVVLWGDHGWHLGEKEHWRKFALWEQATHTPLIIYVPSGSSMGAKCTKPVNLIDLYPTLIELCGLPAKAGLEGNSLAPLLRDPKAAWEHYSLTTHGRNNHSLRSERYHYIRYADGSEELYDHANDPHEWINLASRSELRELKASLVQRLPKVNAPDAPVAAEKTKLKKQ